MFEEYRKQFERFCADIKGHSVTVLREDGLYRHLRCRRGDSYTYGFDVITWPGYLAYTGDMGCFVFSRLPDMFGFFRGRREAMVDRGYLAEKCTAKDKPDGIREYSEERFQEVVSQRFEEFAEGHELTPAQREDLWQQIEDDVLSCGDNHHDAVRAATEFRWVEADAGDTYGREVFTDFWEHRLEEYTSRFWWCCYAIPWAIEQYDRQRSESPPAADAVDPVAASRHDPATRV
jgi:hypothetical protein